MRHPRIVSVAGLMAVTVLVVAACSKSTTEPSGNSALVGNYSLYSITLAGLPTLGPPAATGSMSMTDSTYVVDVTVNSPPAPSQIVVHDEGTYTVSGNSITQTSTIQSIQSVGTYTLSNDTLTVDVTAAGQETKTVWLKQ